MEKISYTSLRQNLSSVLNDIEDNKELYYVTRKQHSEVVMVAREDYESLLETLHLLSSRKNAKKLHESIKQDKSGEYEEIEL